MTTISYGTRLPAIGELEHLGNISINLIESITVREMGSFDEPRTLTGLAMREFWQLNSHVPVRFDGEVWCGLKAGKFGFLEVKA